jgi:biopolymer transport protein ExbD
MSLTLFKSQRPPSEQVESTELDVTPVMNMFIILIPFLVSMAVFTNLSILEFSLPPNVGASMNNSQEKPKPKLTVRVGTDYFGIVLGDTLYDSLSVNNGEYPFGELGQRLRERKQLLVANDDIVIASRDEIAFKHVVKVMDVCRSAGFANVGLSSATVNPGGGM